MATTPIALTIAGSDSSGGAGIQADLKTFSALGTYGASVITALTAQNTRSVTAILDIDPGFIAAQIDTVCSDLAVNAVKIGMLSQSGVIETVADALDRHGLSMVVLDPVMVAKSGDKLLQPDAIAALRRLLIPRALLITPNLPEAGALLDASPPQTEAEMIDAAQHLHQLGARNVLIKGGHVSGNDSTDIFYDGKDATRLYAPRIETHNTHGTGCTLSSAIAAYLAHGMVLPDAVRHAKRYIAAAIGAANRLHIGHGHGPVHHFHEFWTGSMPK